jgi:hypothetical protein
MPEGTVELNGRYFWIDDIFVNQWNGETWLPLATIEACAKFAHVAVALSLVSYGDDLSRLLTAATEFCDIFTEEGAEIDKTVVDAHFFQMNSLVKELTKS